MARCRAASWKTMSCINFFTNWDLNLNLDKNNANIKSLVSNFCDVASEYDCEFDWYKFDASQSVFMSILCSNVWKTKNYIKFEYMTWDSAILKKYQFVSFDIYTNVDEGTKQKSKIDYCNYKGSDMNNCNLAYFVPHIFDELMNDFFNIRQATNMWITELWDTFDKEAYAKVYMDNHFPGFSYQYPEWVCKTKYYKNTCKYLKNYMWQVRNLLTTTKVIDVKNLSSYTNSNKSGVAYKRDCENEFSNNILYCGLLWEQKMPLYSLVRAIYNEYIWYNLFMSYYEYQLEYNTVWLHFTTYDSYEEAIYTNMQKVEQAKDQVAASKQAISDSMRTLSIIDYSLPLHVGFLMYQEDASFFLKNLWKVFTPIRTLSDKLQNVQDADS